MMQVWYDERTGLVKATYTHKYGGDRWANQGYILFDDAPFLPEIGDRIRVSSDGAIVVIEGVVIPEPQAPNPRRVQLGAILAARDFTLEEISEWLREVN